MESHMFQIFLKHQYGAIIYLATELVDREVLMYFEINKSM